MSNKQKSFNSITEFKKEFLPNSYQREKEKKNNQNSFGENLAISIIKEVKQNLSKIKLKKM